MGQGLRLLILGAHPDDAEYHAGGLAAAYRERGDVVRMVSMTNGEAGHFEQPPAELARRRRAEAAAAGAVIGAEYLTWDIPDGQLTADLAARHRVIRELRSFRPDLVLTHRPWDYHPDHRAAGQLVLDAVFLVVVPNVVPSAPAVRDAPVVAYLPDLFTKPCGLVPDVVLDISERFPTIVAMLACHGSQYFEWLPHLEGALDQVPRGEAERRSWLADWYRTRIRRRTDYFREAMIAAFGPARGAVVELCEAYEISEYGAPATREALARLFPTGAAIPRAGRKL